MEFNGPSGRLRIALALIVGLGTIGFGAYSYSVQSTALESAEAVDATIVDTSIEKDASKGVAYRPQATFRYTYEGRTYTASNVYPGTIVREFGSREEARTELAAYEAGETATAYVPPDSPGNAYLRRTSSDDPLLVIGAGVLIVLGSGYSVVSG